MSSFQTALRESFEVHYRSPDKMRSRTYYGPAVTNLLVTALLLWKVQTHDHLAALDGSTRLRHETDHMKRVIGPKKDSERGPIDWITDGKALMCLMDAKTAEDAKSYYVSVTGDTGGASAFDESTPKEWDMLSENGWVARPAGRPGDDILQDVPSVVDYLGIHQDYKTSNLRYKFKHQGNTADWKASD